MAAAPIASSLPMDSPMTPMRVRSTPGSRESVDKSPHVVVAVPAEVHGPAFAVIMAAGVQ